MPKTFSDLGVAPAIVSKLEERGITEAFPIQEATIPDALGGRDIVAKAPTGSGKTLAFGIAAIERCNGARPRRPLCLILEPTRELAAQVRDELVSLRHDGGRRIIAVYGGTRYGPTQNAMLKGVDILVACPGRLEDLIEQGIVELDDVELIVIDEADRMADMGFLPVVRRIVEQAADERQILLFSATMGREVESLVSKYQNNPARHDVSDDLEASGDVEHLFWVVPRNKRIAQIATTISQLGSAIVFCRTRLGADRVARQLDEAGVRSVAIHGDRSQAQRERALRSFERGEASVLVATDVAARGIHLEALPCVIHFDPPADATDYTHRSGRTGRAGMDGVVISILAEDQKGVTSKLQRALGLPTGLTEPKDLEAPAPVVSKIRRNPVRSAPVEERPERPERSGRGKSNDRWSTSGPSRDSRRPAQGRDKGRSRDQDRPVRRPESSPRSESSRSESSPRSESSRSQSSSSGSAGNATGTVKFYDAKRGYGFVERSGQQDMFVHATGLADGPKTLLVEGQKVTFEIGKGKRGEEARNVRVLAGARSGNSRN